MIIEVFFPTVSFVTYIYSGLYVFFLDRGSRLHRYFLLLCLTFAFWSLSLIIGKATDGLMQNIADFTGRLTFLGATLYAIAVFRLFLVMTKYEDKFKNKVVFNIIILLPPAIFSAFSLLGCFNSNDFSDPWYLSFHIYLNVYQLITIIMIIVWGIRSKYRRHKMQAALIVGGAFLVIIIDYILEFLNFADASSTIIVIWILFVWYAIVKYRFLSITPATISNDLIALTKELILFIDVNSEIVIANNAVQTLLQNHDLVHKNISIIIYGYDMLMPELKKIINNGDGEFICRCNLRSEKNEKIPAELIFKTVRDSLGDVIGVMIIGRKIWELKHFMSLYKLTPREMEITQKIIVGQMNKEIARDIGVSLNTMKRHINNIYNKIGIRSKVELLNLLIEFNLVPSQNIKNILLIYDK